MEKFPQQNQFSIQNPSVVLSQPKGRESVSVAVSNVVQITLFQMMSPEVTSENEDELLRKWHDTYAKEFATFCDNCGLGNVAHGEELLERIIQGVLSVDDYEFIKNSLITMAEETKRKEEIAQLH